MESAWISITLIAMRTSRVPLVLLASLQSTARRASCCAQASFKKRMAQPPSMRRHSLLMPTSEAVEQGCIAVWSPIDGQVPLCR